MKTKTKKIVQEVQEPVVQKPMIGLITTDFNRAELNELRDKLNQVISYVDNMS